VFHSRVAVSARKIRCVTLPTPAPVASISNSTRGTTSTAATRALAASNTRGRDLRRGGAASSRPGGPSSCRRSARLSAVSYTHLDVYKRQLVRSSTSRHSAPSGPPGRRFPPKDSLGPRGSSLTTCSWARFPAARTCARASCMRARSCPSTPASCSAPPSRAPWKRSGPTGNGLSLIHIYVYKRQGGGGGPQRRRSRAAGGVLPATGRVSCGHPGNGARRRGHRNGRGLRAFRRR